MKIIRTLEQKKNRVIVYLQASMEGLKIAREILKEESLHDEDYEQMFQEAGHNLLDILKKLKEKKIIQKEEKSDPSMEGYI